MEKQLNYPFINLTTDKLLETAKKIEMKEEDKLNFYIGNNLVEEDKLYLGMISYIKLIESLIESGKDTKELNEIIYKIREDVVTRILDLKDAGASRLLEKLEIENNEVNLGLLSNIIEAYEIEYDVKKSEDPKRYKLSTEKTNDSMQMKQELILKLTKTA